MTIYHEDTVIVNIYTLDLLEPLILYKQTLKGIKGHLSPDTILEEGAFNTTLLYLDGSSKLEATKEIQI